MGDAIDFEIWAGPGLAVLVPAAHPDKTWLTRGLTLKYKRHATPEFAEMVFDRGVRAGYLGARRPPESPAKPRPDASLPAGSGAADGGLAEPEEG